MKFITKDDDFGIRKMLRNIFLNKHDDFQRSNIDFAFNVWQNQFLPPAFYESTGTIQRHIDLINAIRYQTDWVWIKRNNQYSCAIINDSLMWQIKAKEVALPTYEEIEKEKQKWQAHPEYREEEGFSQALEEEFIQLVLHKGGE